MKKIKHKAPFEKERLQFLLGTIPCLLAGFDSWVQNDNLFFALNSFAFLLNILAFFYIGKYSKHLVPVFLSLNAIYFWSLSYHYFALGRVFLPYACIIIGFGYFISIFLAKRKKKNLP
ncbi:MAG: hypothetical protein Q8O72_04335 [Bacteroidales bacterium]|nr:hypothetical protein [Bacteroidales bacterium]